MSQSIADYALLADCNSAALVGRDGSIDWLEGYGVRRRSARRQERSPHIGHRGSTRIREMQMP